MAKSLAEYNDEAKVVQVFAASNEMAKAVRVFAAPQFLMSCGRYEHVEVWSRQMGRTLIILVFDQIVLCFNAGLTFSLVIVDMCVDLSLTPGYLFCISRLL